MATLLALSVATDLFVHNKRKTANAVQKPQTQRRVALIVSAATFFATQRATSNRSPETCSATPLPKLVEESIDKPSTSWREVGESAKRGLPVVLRDYHRGKRLCSPSIPLENEVFVEFDGATPALKDVLVQMGESPGADAVVHVNGQPRRPTLHIDVHPVVQPLMDAFGINPFGLVCSCQGQRKATIVSSSCTNQLASSVELEKRPQIHFVKEGDESRALAGTAAWNVTLHEGDCLVFAPSLHYHLFSTTAGSIGQSTRPLGHSSVPQWFWEKLFHVAGNLGSVDGLGARRVFNFNMKGFAMSQTQTDDLED